MTREQANERPWVAGVNLPGYMPDMEPSAFETFEDARDFLVWLLEEEVNFLADNEACDDEIDEIDQAACIVSHLKEDEFSAIIGRYSYWIMRNN